MAARIRAQNAQSMSKWLAYVTCKWVSSSSIGAARTLRTGIYKGPSDLRRFCVKSAKMPFVGNYAQQFAFRLWLRGSKNPHIPISVLGVPAATKGIGL